MPSRATIIVVSTDEGSIFFLSLLVSCFFWCLSSLLTSCVWASVHNCCGCNNVVTKTLWRIIAAEGMRWEGLQLFALRTLLCSVVVVVDSLSCFADTLMCRSKPLLHWLLFWSVR
jgi:hypothetical protein